GRAGADAKQADEFARGMRPKLEAGGARPPTTALLLACEVGQRAYEIPDEQHGAFTYYLLQGLAGKAKAADGAVTLTSLAGYLQTEVVAWAQRNNRQQTPRFDNPGCGDFPLLRPVRVQEVPLAATLTVTTIPAGATVSVDGQPVGQTPLTVKLPLAGGQARKARVQVSLTGYLDRAADLDLAPGAAANWAALTLERAPTTGAAPLPVGTLPYTVPDYLQQWAQQLPTNLPMRIRAKDGMPEVLIPAGKFWMGSPAGEKDREEDEGPEKEVTLSAYWIDQHEVTNEQFAKFLQDRQPKPEERQAWCALDGENGTASELGYARGQYRPRAGCERWPVRFVSWHGASAYAEWVGRQLPTEAQWERAARRAPRRSTRGGTPGTPRWPTATG
ncbi:MAG: SUMF1/EgtB/PvdO family nonheme iron enzyme, partial [Fimbriimonadaceae bacterium]|nr:SUMF1/EgtB/PvdO family nonheme iron enzyme [Fimbriimonadaceae bacterium]